MTYRTQFPDFPPDEMPAIPEGWDDVSWHNDVCPSFAVGVFQVFVDCATDSLREMPGGKRFIVMGENNDLAFETDEWSEVLAFVERERPSCQHRDDGRGRCIDCGAFISGGYGG